MKVKITDGIREAAEEALADLRVKPRALGHLATGHSDPVVLKALHAMRNLGAPIEYDRATNTWSLRGPWSPPPELMTRAALETEVEQWRGDEDSDDIDPSETRRSCITCGTGVVSR